MSAAAPRSLRDVQKWMVGAIAGSEREAANAAELVTAGPRLSARDRFEIYRSGYRTRLIECLRDDYPVLAATLGESAFEALCEGYIEQHPSSSPNLNAFGRHMAAFCRSAAVQPVSDAPEFFAELATLEWALVEAIHARLPEPFDFTALQCVPVEKWADARLVANRAVRVLRFSYPVNQFYQAARAADMTPALPERGPSATAVYRRGLVVWRMDLTPAMTRVLEALLDEQTIALALSCIGVDETEPATVAEAERSVMVWFREWVDAGFFAGIRSSR